MAPIDMRQGSPKYSNMRHGYFVNLTCDMGKNQRHRHAMLTFLKIDMRHGDPPSRAPLGGGGGGAGGVNLVLELLTEWP